MAGTATAAFFVQHDFMLEEGNVLVAVALALVHVFHAALQGAELLLVVVRQLFELFVTFALIVIVCRTSGVGADDITLLFFHVGIGGGV